MCMIYIHHIEPLSPPPTFYFEYFNKIWPRVLPPPPTHKSLSLSFKLPAFVFSLASFWFHFINTKADCVLRNIAVVVAMPTFVYVNS